MTGTVLKAARWADVEAGVVRAPAVIVVEGNRIQAINPAGEPADSPTVIDLGDVTLLPGLMDMELNLLIGGPGGPEGLPSPMHGVQDDPAYRTLRGAVNPCQIAWSCRARRHHRRHARGAPGR